MRSDQGIVSLTDYSRTKTSCIDSLLQRKLIIENDETEYSGGRRSRSYINGGYGLAGVDIGANTGIDLAVADFSRKILMRYSEASILCAKVY